MKKKTLRQSGKPAAAGGSFSDGIAAFIRSAWSCGWLPGLIIIAATVIAYLPVWHAGFIWDDDVYVTDDMTLRSLDGLRRIWFSLSATPQYYPLTFTTFWVNYHLWGLNPAGYHVTNVLLHSFNAILLWQILRRLGVRGAWLAAAIFALHPVCVESVAWVTERKNTLSGLFYLGSLLACLKFWLPDETSTNLRAGTPAENSAATSRNWKFYWLAIVLYVCALLSKTAAVPLPMVVLLLVWWKRGRIAWRDISPLLLFFVVGIALGLVTMRVEKHIGASGGEWQSSLLERCLLAGRIWWFYLGKLLWPHPLILGYARWVIRATQLAAYLPLLAGLAGLVILWRNRNGWARPIIFASAYFLLLLLPVLGFFNIYFFRYSFVADHFQYLAGIGALALAAAGITTAAGWLRKRNPFLAPVLCGALLLTLGVLTWRQCGMYADIETFWSDTLKKNPDSWMAQNNLGLALTGEGKFDEAMEHYRESLRLNPGNTEAYNNLGGALRLAGRRDEAIGCYRKALEIDPNCAPAQNNWGLALADDGKFDEAILHYHEAIRIAPDFAAAYNNLGRALAAQGHIDEAIDCNRKALQINPQFADALNSLGALLGAKGQFEESAACFREALRLNPDFAVAHNNLGLALSRSGKLDEAVKEYRESLRLAPDYVAARINLAAVLATTGDFENAARNYQAALLVNPNNPAIHFELGRELARLGRREEAAAQFAEALRLKPDYTEAKTELQALENSPAK